MPRRNQDDSGKRRTSGPRSDSRKGTGKSSFRKSKPGSRTRTSDSSAPRNRQESSAGSRPTRQGGSTSRSSRPYSRNQSDNESSKFSQKSRFAKRDAGSRGEGRRDDSKPFGKQAGGPRSKAEGPRTEGPNRFSKSSTPGKRSQGGARERGASFGKPYKKTYQAKADRQSTSTGRKRVETAEAPKSDKIRLNKFIANSGISSRREADELITMGLISVNGNVVTELGYKVSPGDEVRYENKVLRAERPVYILLNKPKGFITTTDDPQERKTVMHIIGSAVKERIYPVGRLDRNTTGLLLLTNDGDLADKLMHPSFNVKKVYKVELDRPLTKSDFQAIIEGVRLEEGRATVDDLAIVSEDGRTVGIELHIGWNRVVRRIFESLNYEVIKLDRTVYAGLDKKELGRGQWRFLTKEEIIHLKHFK